MEVSGQLDTAALWSLERAHARMAGRPSAAVQLDGLWRSVTVLFDSESASAAILCNAGFGKN